jgi:glucose-1-phosphate cytidylyltransferase
MKTIILCGGTGTRLKEETEFIPKPMVKVGGKPILWHIMKQYAFYGFNEFILALGYKADYIKDFFLNQKSFTTDFTLNTNNHNIKYFLKNREDVDDFKITFVDTGLETLPGERVLACKKYLRGEKYFMLTYGDGVSDINIKNLVKFAKKQNTIGTLSGVHPISKYGMFKVGKTSVVKEFIEKPRLPSWVNGGFMVFKKEFLKYLKKGETEHNGLKRIAKKGQLSMHRHKDFWYAIDTYKELAQINKMCKKGETPWMVWK